MATTGKRKLQYTGTTLGPVWRHRTEKQFYARARVTTHPIIYRIILYLTIKLCVTFLINTRRGLSCIYNLWWMEHCPAHILYENWVGLICWGLRWCQILKIGMCPIFFCMKCDNPVKSRTRSSLQQLAEFTKTKLHSSVCSKITQVKVKWFSSLRLENWS